MGCQREIAANIIDSGANYILAVKGNQKELLQAIEDAFRFQPKAEIVLDDDLDTGHGRIEVRKCYVSNNMEYIDLAKWKNCNSVIKVISKRYIKSKKQEEQETVRYYISSLNTSAQEFNKYIRSHWGIENSLHWMLDVSFREDASRKRHKNSAVNFSIVFKTALTMLKKYKVYPNKRDISVRRKRKIGG